MRSQEKCASRNTPPKKNKNKKTKNTRQSATPNKWKSRYPDRYINKNLLT